MYVRKGERKGKEFKKVKIIRTSLEVIPRDN